MEIPISTKIERWSMMIRGTYINHFTQIERIVEEYIVRHFCNEVQKNKELSEFILCEHVSFEAKRYFLEYLLKTYEPALFISYQQTLKDLTKAAVFRNKMAHWMVDTSDTGEKAFLENKLVFIRFLNKTEYMELNAEKIEEMNKLVFSCHEMMGKLLEKDSSHNPTT